MSNYWLFKSEPEDFSISEFETLPQKTTYWDGVRNYQARNFLRDSIKKGDGVLLYQSNTDPLAVVALCKVVKEGYPDFTAQDTGHKHFDPKATPENPVWFMVDIQLQKKLKNPVTLEQLRNTKGLENMFILRRGNRLSVTPVTKDEWDIITALGK